LTATLNNCATECSHCAMACLDEQGVKEMTRCSFNSIAIGLSVQLPVALNFAENQTREKVKGMVHVSFAF
jgi:hypothetical protein